MTLRLTRRISQRGRVLTFVGAQACKTKPRCCCQQSTSDGPWVEYRHTHIENLHQHVCGEYMKHTFRLNARGKPPEQYSRDDRVRDAPNEATVSNSFLKSLSIYLPRAHRQSAN